MRGRTNPIAAGRKARSPKRPNVSRRRKAHQQPGTRRNSHGLRSNREPSVLITPDRITADRKLPEMKSRGQTPAKTNRRLQDLLRQQDQLMHQATTAEETAKKPATPQASQAATAEANKMAAVSPAV